MISVIVPVYNVERYVKKCIESIINQTFKDIEIIIINDGSTDRSGEICSYYEKIDSRIKLIHKENGGLSSARNLGLDYAKGEYIIFIDSDDWIELNYMEVLLNTLLKNKSDIAQCGYVIDGDEQSSEIIIDYNETIIKGKEAIKQLYNKKTYINTVVAWNKLYKKEIFKNIRFPEGRINEDEAIIHEILYNARTIAQIDYTLYHYVVRNNSITKSEFSLKRLDAIKAFEDRLNFFKENNEQELIDMTIPFYFRTLLGLACNIKYSNIDEKGPLIEGFILKINSIKNNLKINIYMDSVTRLLWYSYKLSPKIAIIVNKTLNSIKKLR